MIRLTSISISVTTLSQGDSKTSAQAVCEKVKKPKLSCRWDEKTFPRIFDSIAFLHFLLLQKTFSKINKSFRGSIKILFIIVSLDFSFSFPPLPLLLMNVSYFLPLSAAFSSFWGFDIIFRHSKMMNILQDNRIVKTKPSERRGRRCYLNYFRLSAARTVRRLLDCFPGLWRRSSTVIK